MVFVLSSSDINAPYFGYLVSSIQILPLWFVMRTTLRISFIDVISCVGERASIPSVSVIYAIFGWAVSTTVYLTVDFVTMATTCIHREYRPK